MAKKDGHKATKTERKPFNFKDFSVEEILTQRMQSIRKVSQRNTTGRPTSLRIFIGFRLIISFPLCLRG